MRFAVLGPLLVTDRDATTDTGWTIAATKQRALLAVLLVNANRVVPLGRLIEELWEDAPQTAGNVVRQYISQVRKLLADGASAGVQVRTHAAGYVLTAGRDACDVHEFETLTRRAHRQFGDGQAVLARETVQRALRLWRGQAYADVPYAPCVSAERARLEELRVSAQELGARASLGAGERTTAISELTALTIRYPLRESLYAQLMRALAEAGRKADALATYRTAREVFVNELGLEPSPELRQIERLILTGEPFDPPAFPVSEPVSGPVSEPVSGGPPAPALDGIHAPPSQLPAELADFVGRGQLITELSGLLCRGLEPADAVDDRPAGIGWVPSSVPPVTVLSGMPGVGKTALAVRLGHRLSEAFPDGQIFLRMTDRGAPSDPVDLLGRALESLGRPSATLPADLPARQETYRDTLAGRRVLIVLDDAADEAQVRPLLPGRNGCAVLVTSRSPLAALDSARRVAVPAFSSTEAVRLLALVAGPERVRADPDAARAIGASCGGLPVAIRVAGTRLGNLPHRSLRHMAELLDSDRIFDELVVGDLEVRRLMAAVYTELAEDDRRLLCALAGAVAAGTGGTVALTEGELGVEPSTVDKMVEAGVLDVAVREGDGQARFSCAELLRRYAERQQPVERRPLAEHHRSPGPLGVVRHAA